MKTIEVNGNFSLSLKTTETSLPKGINTKVTNTSIAKSIVSSQGTLLNEYNGVYHPNNDYISIHQFSPSDQANLIVCIVDNPVGFYISSAGGAIVQSLVIDGLIVIRMKGFSQSNGGQLVLDSRIGITSTAVDQSTPINYYIAILDDTLMSG